MSTNQPGKHVRKDTVGTGVFPMGPIAIQAPWRLEYLEDDTAAHAHPASSSGSALGSFLAEYWEAPENDSAHFVIERNDVGMVLLNRFPYSNGHLLVALGEPRPTLMEYGVSQRAALWQLVDRATDLVQSALSPQGINIGINQGRAAGAGVPHHLHAHVVPRWSGDVNFMSVVGQIRVIPSSLEAMYSRFRRVIDAGG